MFKDGSSDDVWELTTIMHKISKPGEFPEDWGMEAGYEFVLIGQ